MDRPGAGDFAPYYGTYVDQVPDGDILATLARQIVDTTDLVRSADPSLATHRYGPDKWCVADVLGHMADTERLFTYRALSFARGDAGPLPGMEQDDWVVTGGADRASLDELARELETVRQATLTLFARMGGPALERRGVASGVEFAVRAFPWVIAGHELHHRVILVERYGLGGGAGG